MLNKGDSLPDDHDVIRIIHNDQRAKDNFRHPNTSQFIPRKGTDNTVSVDYREYTHPEKSLAIFGSQYRIKPDENGNPVFKDPKCYSLFYINICFLKEFDKLISDVVFDPLIDSYGCLGKPKNNAHSNICFNEIPVESEPEFMAKIKTHLVDKELKDIDWNIVDKYIDQLRKNPDTLL